MRTLLLGLLAVPLLSAAQPAATPSTRDVMKKLNRGPTSLTPSIGQDLKDDDPDWEAVQEQTAEYVKLTAALPKNKAPKGPAASWERLTKAYHDDARALDAAARRKDKRGAQAALGRINRSCLTCHLAHKPE